MLARRDQGAKPAEQLDDVTIGGKERDDDLVASGHGDSLLSIFFRFRLLDIFARHCHRLSSIIDTLDRFTMDGGCKSVSKPVLNESEHMAALPSSIGPICMGASGLGLIGLGLELAVPGTLALLAGRDLRLASIATDLNAMWGRNCTSRFIK